MAALSNSSLPNASVRPGNTTSTDGPKLRNSCQACADSKLKCSKERPRCARCIKRGVPCEYFAVKRAGRKPSGRSQNTNPHSPGATVDAQRSPDLVRCSPRPTSTDNNDVMQELFGPIGQALSSQFNDNDINLDEYFHSPMSLMTDTYDTNIFDPTGIYGLGLDNSNSSNASESLPDAMPIHEDALFRLPITVSTSSTSRSSPSKELNESHILGQGDTPCSCLVQALAIMKQLCARSANACATWSPQGSETPPARPSIQTVIESNKTTIQTLNSIMDCSCSHDDYLLAVMSLIVLKVLGWYASAARETPTVQGSRATPHSRSSSISTIGSYNIEGEDSVRMTAQLVLNELHHVRRLIEQLSAKLRVQSARKRGAERADAPESMQLDCEMTLPFSAMLYDQLDGDLRKWLKALSLELIDRLKRF